MSRHVRANPHRSVPRHSFRYVFAATPALLLSLCHPSMVYAACTGTSPASGITVTCSGSGVVPVIAQSGASYLHNIDNLHQRGATADLGLRILWGAGP